jgi:hypothetical protein
MSQDSSRTPWRKPHAKVITVGKAFIDHLTEIEITLHTDEMQLHLIVYRIPEQRGFTLRVEELGPFSSVGELHLELQTLFGEPAARKALQPSSAV